jgi:predicted nuclease with TOPRIM domain
MAVKKKLPVKKSAPKKVAPKKKMPVIKAKPVKVSCEAMVDRLQELTVDNQELSRKVSVLINLVQEKDSRIKELEDNELKEETELALKDAKWVEPIKFANEDIL